ncbi:MAG: T9SS C-terminal target domain-containing protein, partial [Crocinitomicaceae bacterium]|nr:T9SS C-terminal target domain-containing protein [Crocinitomicaceae bacterium]
MKKTSLLLLLIVFSSTISFSQTFLTNGQVYDFNVGDVVQGNYLAYGPFGGGPPTYETRTILGKELVASLDTIRYTVKRDFYTPPSCPTCSPTFSYDTIIQTVTNLTLPAVHNNATDCYSLRDTLYLDTCDRLVWEKIPVYVDTCFEPITHTTRVVEGVGGVFFTKSDPSSGGATDTQFILTYYSKNTGSCGNLTNDLIEIQAKSLPIQIFPNPASETFTISLPENASINDCVLLDNLGKEVKRFVATKGENLVDISELESGIYFIQIDSQISKL